MGDRVLKRLLMINAEFPPSRAIGGQRVYKIAMRIRDFGWEPFVLTMPPRCQYPIDWTFGKEVAERTPRVLVPCWSIWRHSTHYGTGNWGGIPGIISKVVNRLTVRLLPVDYDWTWALAATGPGVQQVRREKIDLIWATGPWWSTFVLARRIAQRTGVPFVMDFRDILLPVARPTRRQRRYFQLETQLLQDAAGVTFTAPEQEGVIDGRAPWMRQKPRCLIHNWFDAQEDVGSERRTFEGPTILHGGTLYGGIRRVDGFFEALSLLRRNGASPARDVRFAQFGSEEVDNALISRLGLGEAVQVRPSVSRGELFAWSRGAEILLLVVGHDVGVYQHAGAVPGKLYDYMRVGKPILVIGPRGCYAGEVVQRCRRGMAAADDDPPAIAKAIEHLLRGQGSGGPLDLSTEGVKEFEATHVVRKLADFLESLVSPQPRQ
jgi:glycosyltransferase involved in cell wall biosynthesis